MRILFIGDIVGQPGRKMVARHLQRLVATNGVDVVIANAENAAAGFGITPAIGQELLGLGIALLTSGNHVWDKKEAEAYLKTEGRILRPANYPDEVPGNGKSILRMRDQLLGVVNLQGRAFLPPSTALSRLRIVSWPSSSESPTSSWWTSMPRPRRRSRPLAGTWTAGCRQYSARTRTSRPLTSASCLVGRPTSRMWG